MVGMYGLRDFNRGPGYRDFCHRTWSILSPGSPSKVCRPRKKSLGSDTSSNNDAGTDSCRSRWNCVGKHCYYEERLRSRYPMKNDDEDYFLQEHITSGHLSPCSPLSASSADRVVQTAPVREEIPFGQVHCLRLVNLRDELLSPRHIRLLKLCPPISSNFPGDIFDARERLQLRCDAYQASLHELTTRDRPLFAAASYVCGDQTPTHRIICGRNWINIPQNTYDVLRHLRFKDRPRLFWIDCLCIKQDDAREKSHQVGMLHTIYAQAHVVSWLGTGRGMVTYLKSMSLSLSLFQGGH
jgi:hypothetical protein